jgi:hypothetical protein
MDLDSVRAPPHIFKNEKGTNNIKARYNKYKTVN